MEIIENYNLRDLSYWNIGGTARLYIRIHNTQEYSNAISLAMKLGVTPIVVGKTSNLLFDDGLLNIAIIELSGEFSDIKVSENRITVGSAVSSQKLVRFGYENSLFGLEHIIGIPATVGGLVYMNGGSNRKTVSEKIVTVESFDKNDKLIIRKVDECNFSYRKSIFQDNKELICKTTFEMICTSNVKDKKRECINILSSRRHKFPRKLPSCGSVFISYPEMYEKFGPPGKIIENLGLKGVKIGDAEISAVHANFIVNNGNATSSDVLALVNLINTKVEREFGFTLESEAIFISKYGEIKPLHHAM
ncbi:UDP-N-acetylmuramate dehydrogenase [Vibrio cyclitrophicus]|uniref:UDP-N-acetylmuramate dehydrogenase n=1 Tax=Vibrio cyclitrophicus TaxID=47951 RepID=UPI000C823F30|nr:UDP-N-acetylmuramate dehydrogenase [Vibrio cyclitrophicus]PMG32825.1 UDP-N-acetylenolpyruvoylglucosamine reductase [Vibrio cyclitrophicus]